MIMNLVIIFEELTSFSNHYSITRDGVILMFIILILELRNRFIQLNGKWFSSWIDNKNDDDALNFKYEQNSLFNNYKNILMN